MAAYGPPGSGGASPLASPIPTSISKRGIRRLVTENLAIEETDEYGRTLLVRAVERGDVNEVRALLEAGASVEARSANGFTCLLIACVTERVDIARELLRFGADVRARDRDGRSVISYVSHHPNLRDLLLVRAARDGYYDVVQELLRAGAALNARDHDAYTPLIAAASAGHWPVMRELFAYSAEGVPRGAGGRRSSGLGGVQLYGPGPGAASLEIEAVDARGRTAIMHAAAGGYLQMVKDLVDKGASPLRRDEAGSNALLAAAEKGHLNVVRYLIEESEGAIEVCGERGAPLLQALVRCRDVLPFEKCSRHKVRAALLFSREFAAAADTDKLMAFKLNGLRGACVELAARLLDAYTQEYAKRLLGHVLEGQSILALALEAKAYKFIGHAFVQDFVNDVWTGRSASMAGASDAARPYSLVDTGRLKLSPRTKFWLEMMTYFIYLVLFSYVLWTRSSELGATEVAMYVYILCMAIEEWRQMHTVGLGAYFGDVWNVMDQVMLTTVGGAACVRVYSLATGSLEHVDRAYDILACSAVLLWIRLLNIFSFHPKLGEMLTIIIGMFTDFLTFSAILGVVLIGFSQAFQALWATGPEDRPNFFSASNFLFRAMLGDIQYEQSMVGSPYLGRVIFSAFLILTNILLLNLLIASFSNTITAVSVASRDTLLFKLTERVLLYEEGGFRLPPPFNLLEPLIALLLVPLARCLRVAPPREEPSPRKGPAPGTVADRASWRKNVRPVAMAAAAFRAGLEHEPPGAAPGGGGRPLLSASARALSLRAGLGELELEGGEEALEEWIEAPFRGVATGARAGEEDAAVAALKHTLLPAIQEAIARKTGALEERLGEALGALQARVQGAEARQAESLAALHAKVDGLAEGLRALAKKGRLQA